MNIEVFLSPSTLTDEDVKDRTVVVIDVLRASSTILTALANGAGSVVPVTDMEEAGKMASNMDASGYLLGGERDGKQIEGYHLGNSPLEYNRETVEGKTIILNTTNGTRALTRSTTAKALVVGGMLNASAVANFVRDEGRDAVLVCAGRRNRVALEDLLCAGLLLDDILDDDLEADATDGAYLAYIAYRDNKNDISGAIRRTQHARSLIAQDSEDDVMYCARTNELNILPYYREQRLIRYAADASGSEAPQSLHGDGDTEPESGKSAGADHSTKNKISARE